MEKVVAVRIFTMNKSVLEIRSYATGNSKLENFAKAELDFKFNLFDTVEMIHHRTLFCAFAFLSSFSLSAAGSRPEATNLREPISKFISEENLQKDFRAFCLKQQVTDSPAEFSIIETTSRMSQGVSFESVRFEMSKKGIDKQPDCRGEREIVQLVGADSKRVTLVDSGVYPMAYCEEPVRISHVPIVYEMESLGEGQSNQKKRKLAVVEMVSSTLPCPDVVELKTRRFLITDLENPSKPLLDIQGDFILHEKLSRPWRLDLGNVTKVLRSSVDLPPGKVPSEIELNKGKFSIIFRQITNPVMSNEKENVKRIKDRIQLNSIYSKDRKHVYYETVDESGRIEGANPNTFQLLSSSDESAYTKDDKNVFFFGKAIPTADAKTFVQLNERYGKDVKHVFFMDSIFSEADVSSFVASYKGVWYAKDKNHVYSSKKIVQRADPQTFTTGEDRSCGDACIYRSEDKNNRFGLNDQVVQRCESTK